MADSDAATSLSVGNDPASADSQTPTTPRPAAAVLAHPGPDDPVNPESDPKTPTNHNSGGSPEYRQSLESSRSVEEQSDRMDLSNEPPSAEHAPPQNNAQPRIASQDVEMADADDPGGEDEGSDNDSVTSDSQRPSKKKKGQRFYCTDFPPCQLSFTRSEHLARHIRKHTGERPFQCHCSRRFSRLDNLRQHAQTVHINEEIPGDSLAATSTRFQRQIRTDRVRPPGSRSRANTMGSNGGHSRGHSRNISTSSIGSTASSMGMPEETRKRPPPLAMASGDHAARARLSLETYNAAAAGNPPPYPYYSQSPAGYSTPTSTIYSTETGSPRFGSGMPSPSSTMSRSSFYNGPRHNRRLSVPSSHNAFQSGVMSAYPPPYYGAPMQSTTMPPFSPYGTVFGSPTSSVYSHSRRDSETELEYRRRTWHPGTYQNYSQRPATSGLSYHQTPDDQQPAASDQPAASQVTRLPGIESFDNAARQKSSPMMMDASPRPTSSGRASEAPVVQAPAHIQHVTPSHAPVEGQWQSAYQQGNPPQGSYSQQPFGAGPQTAQRQPVSMPEPVTPRKNKRQAWYGGPVNPPASNSQGNYSTLRRSPEDSGSSDGAPTPSTSQGNEYHPVIINPAGMPEPLYPAGAVMSEDHPSHAQQQKKAAAHPPPAPQTYALQAGHGAPFTGAVYAPPPPAPSAHDMGRLEALVAVATREDHRAVERS